MIEGCDTSHWQGQVDWIKAYAKGIRFAWIKVSQGTGYQDDFGKANSLAAQAAGVKVGPYHFCTTDAAAIQAAWFISCLTNGVTWDLPPALDVEYYNALSLAEPETQHELRAISMEPRNLTKYYSAVRGLSLPTETTVDTIGRALTTWMIGKPNMAAWVYPAIYTNASSGNVTFKSPAMARYNLWVASWTTAPTPTKPTVWAKEKYIGWQNYVIHGAQDWGVDGDLDHDIWGDKFAFPGDPIPPPPPAATITADVSVDVAGVKYFANGVTLTKGG
jgi:GH25 family lysozyme M1 (1,4-beta-N-acetylmuramidase)